MQFVFIFITRKTSAPFSESGYTTFALDLFIKFDSIGAKILTMTLIIFVGILSQPTLLLILNL